MHLKAPSYSVCLSCLLPLRWPQSTLVNAMIGTRPRAGPALVSDRAGWTDQICFYQLGRRPPLFNLVDLPGYGHAVADDSRKHAWKTMIRDYLRNRPILSKCCILVDCTRGLCVQDFNYIRYLSKVCSASNPLLLTR